MSEKVVEFKPKGKKHKRKKGNSGVAVFIIIIFIAIFGIGIYLYINNGGSGVKGLEQQKVLSEINYESSSMADFYTYDRNIYFCTKESMTLMDKMGQQAWKDSYSMLDPIMVYDGSVVAIADELGTNLRVYNSNGILYNVETECPISTFAVNENGYCGIIMKDENSYILNLYSETGALKCTGNYPAEKGIPVALEISNDNKIYSVSFLNTNEIKVSSNVVFYYIEDADIKTSEEGESMFASFVEENSVVAVMEFMEDNSLIAVSDNSITCAKVNTVNVKYEQKWRVELNNQLKSVAFLGNKYLVTANAQPIINSAQKENENLVKWYDLNGQVTGTYENGKNITNIYASENGTVIACDRSFVGVNSTGKELWSYTSVREITRALLFDDSGSVMMVSPGQMRIINMSKGDNIDESYPVREDKTKPESEQTTDSTAEQTTETATQSEKATEATTKNEE